MELMNIRKHLAVIAIAASAFSAGAAMHLPNPFDKPCKNEGSNGCYWDASKSGNGKGKSYVVTKSGQVFYYSKSMSAHKHPFYDREQCVGMPIPNPCVPDSNN